MRNLRQVTVFAFVKIEKHISADASAFVFRQRHFDSLTAASSGSHSTLPPLPSELQIVATAKPKPLCSAEGSGNCVWPSILTGSTNCLIILPHGAGGRQAGITAREGFNSH